MAKIGFIGLGHMGFPMSLHLSKAGHELMVLDLNRDAVTSACEHGAQAAKDIAELAEFSEIIFTMLQTGEQVSSVCLGDDGIFAHANDNTLYIDSSSIDVATSRDLHQQAEASGLRMLDAPVSGGVAGAENASLTIMVGGEDDIFEAAQPILSLLGKTIVHAGVAGNGQVAKICNNMILGISMIGISEAFMLGEKLGLSPEKLFEISSQSSGQCWSMTSYAPLPGLVPPSPANNNYEPGFTSKMMLKDLRLSQEAAESANASTPLGAEATALYSMFVNQGYGGQDFSAIIKLFAEIEKRH